MFRPMKFHHQEVNCRIKALWYNAVSNYILYYSLSSVCVIRCSRHTAVISYPCTTLQGIVSLDHPFSGFRTLVASHFARHEAFTYKRELKLKRKQVMRRVGFRIHDPIVRAVMVVGYRLN